MTVIFGKHSTVTIVLTVEQLAVIRHAVDTGTIKLESTARYLKSMNSEAYRSAEETANRARAASNALEQAVNQGIKDKRTNS